jgi:ATP-dependent phosphoenolpyruvate carboxykinase
MHPEKEWNSWVEYDETLASLAIEFTENFKNKFKGQLGEDEEQIVNAGPSIL